MWCVASGEQSRKQLAKAPALPQEEDVARPRGPFKTEQGDTQLAQKAGIGPSWSPQWRTSPYME